MSTTWAERQEGDLRSLLGKGMLVSSPLPAAPGVFQEGEFWVQETLKIGVHLTPALTRQDLLPRTITCLAPSGRPTGYRVVDSKNTIKETRCVWLLLPVSRSTCGGLHKPPLSPLRAFAPPVIPGGTPFLALLSLDSSFLTLETYFTPEGCLNCLGESSAPLPVFHSPRMHVSWL